jgi:hypothetical protein
MAAAIAAAPEKLIFDEFKFRVVSDEQQSAMNAMEAAPISCKELTDRLREMIEWGGRRMRTSARAQHDAAVMPKLARLIDEIALFLRMVSMLLLFVAAQASDALLYLHRNSHRPSVQTPHDQAREIHHAT